MSATRRLSGEPKQLGAESKRAASAVAGIGKGMMKVLRRRRDCHSKSF